MNLRLLVPALLAVCAWAEDPWAALATASVKPAAEAEPALEELLRVNPGFHAARFNLGTLLLSHDPAKAAAQLELATAAADLTLAADAYHNLALARQRQGRLEDALLAATEAAKRNPAYAGLRDEMRRIAVARADAARLKAEEEAKKLALSATALPPARVGEAYRAPLPLRGGTGPYAVKIAVAAPSGTTVALDPKAPPPPAPSSLLPPGLELSAEGILSGTPTADGEFQLPVEITDAASAVITGSVKVQVLPVPAITTATLPEAIIGLPYQATLQAVGLGTPTWSASGLPAGLSCRADGTISGTPTALGPATVSLTASEVVAPPLAPHQATRNVTLEVTDSFAPDSPPIAATSGAAYEHRLGVRGPAQAYSWRSPATQSSPLTVDPDGRLHGTPVSEGTAEVATTIVAADGRTRDIGLKIPVNPRPLIALGDPLKITAASSADVTIPHTGGTPPFTWKVLDGNLPAGIRLDPDGHFRGVAKDPGTYTVTVQLADRWQASTQTAIPLQVDPASSNQQGDQANKDEPKKDEPQDQQPDGKKGDDHQGNDQKDGKDGEQAQKPGEQPKANDQPGQTGKPEAQPGKQEAGQEAGKSEQAKAGEDQAQQAAALNQMAADRWLDQLPAEDRDVLRYQLLEGGERKPQQKQGKNW